MLLEISDVLWLICGKHFVFNGCDFILYSFDYRKPFSTGDVEAMAPYVTKGCLRIEDGGRTCSL